MIDRKDLLALAFYKRSAFTGSDKGLCYRIEKTEKEIPQDPADSGGVVCGGAAASASGADQAPSGDAPVKTETVLRVWAWPGPYAFAKTPDEAKAQLDLPFSEEGLQAAAAWLNSSPLSRENVSKST